MPRGHHHHRRHHGGSISSFGRTPVLPTLALPFFSSTTNTISYQGPLAGFIVQFYRLTPEEKQATKVFNIQINGDIVQESKPCCLLSTIILGGFFILPIFLLCCDCFKRRTAELRKLPVEAYSELTRAIDECPNLQAITLVVADNYLQPQQTRMIEDAVLRKPNVSVFAFRNIAAPLDLDQNEYSSFGNSFSSLRQSTRANCIISWGTTIVTNQLNGVQPTELSFAIPMVNQPG